MKILKKMLGICTALTVVIMSSQAQELPTLTSPNGRVTAAVSRTSSRTMLTIGTTEVTNLTKVQLGLELQGSKAAETNLYNRLQVVSVSDVTTITEDYTLLHGKTSHATNEATAVTVHLRNSSGLLLDVEVRAYDDGVAFRYIIPESEAGAVERVLQQEMTSYTIVNTMKRWLQPENTAYEGDFPYQASGGQTGGWLYPCLFEKSGTFCLITEAGMEGQWCSTHLNNTASSGQYKVTLSGNPKWTGEWKSPWRVVMVGTLKEIVESTLVQDVSAPCALTNTSWIEPGSAAWVYWAYNHGSNDYQICRQYVDLAVEMGWPYVLIDWEWEGMGNGGNIHDIIAYAQSKGKKVMVWYDSKNDKLTDATRRKQELQWLKNIGVVGIKVDFFADWDSQTASQYHIDLLKDAAQEKMLMNFHGCTVPRGWTRTYPHLMSTEAVFGAEQYNNWDYMTENGAHVNCILPYTRNVVGPMDYTPVAFTDSQHPHTTSYAHELALSVAFESGIQHWADRPSGFYDLPPLPKQHMKDVPTAWDETRFVGGYPAESFVVARRKGDVWYVGGLNGKDTAQTLNVPMEFVGEDDYVVSLIADGDVPRSFRYDVLAVTGSDVVEVECLRRGGFVMTLKKGGSHDLTALEALQDEVQNALVQTEGNIGYAMGQYRKQAVDDLQAALDESRDVTASSTASEIDVAYQRLSMAYADFQENGYMNGGLMVEEEGMEDLTAEYLVEARNFSRDDESSEPTSRFGLLAAPWIVTDNIINQDNGSHGGFDSFEGGRAISVEKWDGGEPAMVNDKIYQYTKEAVSAGTYHLHISVTARYGLTDGKCLLRVARGEGFPDKGVDDDLVLASFDMSQTDYSGEYDVCTFTLTEPSVLALGWLLNVPQNEGSHAFRVTAIRLIDENGTDVSATYLGNYQNIQRKDRSYSRFGIPTYWEVENFNIPNGTNGVKQGIDRYPGYDCLMLGVWDDRQNATGEPAQANLYREVTLPAGSYFFGAAYNAIYNLSKAYIYAASAPVTAAETEENAMAFYPISGCKEGSDFYGITFTLEEETTLALGWNADLTTANQQEFRAKQVKLMKYAEPEPTTIEKVQGTKYEVQCSDAVFDLSGRRVLHPTKGLYIVNGKKFFIR